MASFDASALSKLTARLDSKLAESKNKRIDSKDIKSKRKLDQSADSAQPPAKKRNQQGKTDFSQNGQQNRKPNASPHTKPKAQPRDRQPFAKPNGKPNGKPNIQSGARQAHGKPSTQSRNSSSSYQDKKPQATPQASNENVLLDEIKALGGDEDDYKLVGDIDSDDDAVNEQAGRKDADRKLRDELASFAAGLGFDQVQPDPVGEESDADDDQGHEDVSADEDGEDVEQDDEGDESDNDEAEDTPATDPKRKTIFEPRPDWYAAQLKALPTPTSDGVTPFTATISALKHYAKTLLDEDTTEYSASFAASSTRKFMSTIMSSGTMSDKVSALTLAIQESPVHNIKAFENLLALGAKRSRGPALAALAALVDLLGPGMILPSDRRLRTFASQLGLIGTLQKFNIKSWSAGQELPGKISKAHLLSWYFEDWLKDAYFKMIQSLEIWCDDEVEYARTKAVDQVFALLRDKPEQESNLLRLLVNKLGDRDRKIASRSSYLLLQLLTTHPRMKQVVVKSIEDVIFRPGQKNRAKYYAVNTLNQTILSSKEPELADSLLRVYFGMFLSLLKSGDLGHLDGALDGTKKEKPGKQGKQRRKPRPSKDADESKADAGETEAAEKLVSAILTGVNRAVPFSQADQSTLESHLNTLFHITHSSNFNTSIQALMLIQQLSATRQLATERYYRTLYESLLDPRLITSSKQALYLNLLYRSLKADVDVRRVKAFVKRMLQILNVHQPSFVCGILYLATELSITFPDLNTLLSEPEEHEFEERAALPTTAGTSGEINDGFQVPEITNSYDGRKRNPEYSNAHLSCLWELLPFLKHYHPSVDVFAQSFLSGENANKKPDLANHTLISFLDKFVYKNAKATDQVKGASIMQPIVASGQSKILLSSKPSAKDANSVNSASFWNKKSDEVAVEDAFFHEYFTNMGKPGQAEREQQRKAKKDAAGDGEDEDDEEANEDEIWDALVNSRPEIQEDSDDGADFDDMMSLDDSEKEFRKAMEEDDDDDDDALNLDDSDMELSDDMEDEEEEEEPAAAEKKDEKKPESERKRKKKALKALPLFASADDYAEMLAQDADGM
ncbi:CBF-domain-containing protein [Astrocystis sublimbata]|nr:CBF-domain-containing protein [Astrocystis sublimbata]